MIDHDDTGKRTCAGFTKMLLPPTPAELIRQAAVEALAAAPPPERRARRIPRDR